jgi:hypothetical protein
LNSLLKQAKDAPQAGPRTKSWPDKLTPSQRKEVDELIDLWNANELRDKFPTTSDLARFIKKQPYITVQCLSIRNYILERADGKTR